MPVKRRFSLGGILSSIRRFPIEKMIRKQAFRYVFLLPLLAMVIFVTTFIEMFKAGNDALLTELRIDIKQDLNLVADQSLRALGQGADWISDPHSYRSHIVNSAELLDRREMTFAAAYVESQDSASTNRWGYEMVSARSFNTFELAINPFDSAVFRDAVAQNEHGELAIRYEGTGADGAQTERLVYLYFRWAPMVSGQPSRYLMVIGVSEMSLQVHVFDGINRAIIALVILTTILNIGLIAILGRINARINPRSVKSEDEGARP
ncbi:hypothetical protein AGMMS49992_07580 [Clostridia bacterium]|nr:hypothetical protein AGMMS49992_07580 [Clostridia bacterium]